MIGVTASLACAQSLEPTNAMTQAHPDTSSKPLSTLVLAGGCFWCVEAIYEELRGVHAVENGYAGGDRSNPTYQQVSTGATGHAEVVKITYDPAEISADDLLRVFFAVHDPTTLNRQGGDVGTQYRSAIFYSSDEEKARAEKIKAEISKSGIWPNPIVTTIEPLKNYTRAEEYHQDYFARYEKADEVERMKFNAGYCAAVVEPKVRKFRKEFVAKLKRAS